MREKVRKYQHWARPALLAMTSLCQHKGPEAAEDRYGHQYLGRRRLRLKLYSGTPPGRKEVGLVVFWKRCPHEDGSRLIWNCALVGSSHIELFQSRPFAILVTVCFSKTVGRRFECLGEVSKMKK
jgi:hypothetical protein